jgi:hypothetical protein
MNLHRSNKHTHTTYHGDGRGRDSYIIFSNGGLNELRKYNGVNTHTAFKVNNYRSSVSPAP